jgi:SAM-dependent methyltransferase
MAFLSSFLSQERLNRILPYIYGDVLDIGCQEGQLRNKLGGRITSYAGIDMTSYQIIKAREDHPDCEFKILNLDDESIGYENQFDTIVMPAVIEHIFNLKHVGLELAASLRPGGRIIITSPTNFGNDVVHRIGCTLGLFSKVAEDDHIVIFNRKRFEIFASEVGLKLKKYRRFQFGCNQLVILEKP